MTTKVIELESAQLLRILDKRKEMERKLFIDAFVQGWRWRNTMKKRNWIVRKWHNFWFALEYAWWTFRYMLREPKHD